MKRRNLILFIFILIFLIISLFFFLNKTQGEKVIVSKNNEIIAEYNLNKNILEEINFNGETNIIQIENKEVSVIEANCNNLICVNSQSIKNVGETIVCLPHNLVIEIVEN